MWSALDWKTNLLAFRELLSLLTQHRHLTLELAKREVWDRYTGQTLGILWSLGHPLIQMVTYVVVFGFVFNIRLAGKPDLPQDYTLYLLSGLVPWLAFQESMSKSSSVIVGHANLVKQVVFPIAVLPVKTVIASLYTQVVFLLLLMLYSSLIQGALVWTFMLVPLLLAMQILAMIGVGYILSSVGVYFRDIRELVQVFCGVCVYLMPTFYPPNMVPTSFEGALLLNPFSYLVWCYQDAIYYGSIQHPIAWIMVSSSSAVTFILGYRFFRKMKVMFGNVL